MTPSTEFLPGMARQFPDLVRASVFERVPAITVALTAALGLLTFLIVLASGGAPNALMQLSYIPITLAAYRGGPAGGVLVGLMGAVMMGPVLSALDLQQDGEVGWPWVVRGVIFVTVGVVVGWLHTHTRSLAAAWRDAALEVTTSQREGMLALARAAEAKDPTTGDHMYRCRDLAGELAREAGLDEDRVADVAWSAMLHDVGKLYVPDHILVKPGPLTDAEWTLVREHPTRGAQILEYGRMFETARRIVRWHHENLDGTGYPDGLRGDAIPLEARIVRIVDAWDAMRNDRPYRTALGVDQALDELHRYAGSHFDPELVALFIRFLERGTPPRPH